MSFLLPCPVCGPRDVYEFRWGGEQSTRPAPGSPADAWARYLYFRRNEAGIQQEWWYHRAGCRRWFLARRDTRTNEVHATFRPGSPGEPRPGEPAGRAEPPSPGEPAGRAEPPRPGEPPGPAEPPGATEGGARPA
jgi:sarcosine oxidase subunit delta